MTVIATALSLAAFAVLLAVLELALIPHRLVLAGLTGAPC